MSRIESVNTVQAYEENGKDCFRVADRPTMVVKNHWNRRDFVMVKIGETTLTVCADDLIAAIENSQNANK